MSYAFQTVFITCEICQRITNGCDKFNDQIERFEWYLFPANIQRILPTIIINVQQPVYFECFGSIACNRDAFKQVRAKTFAYFDFNIDKFMIYYFCRLSIVDIHSLRYFVKLINKSVLESIGFVCRGKKIESFHIEKVIVKFSLICFC